MPLCRSSIPCATTLCERGRVGERAVAGGGVRGARGPPGAAAAAPAPAARRPRLRVAAQPRARAAGLHLPGARRPPVGRPPAALLRERLRPRRLRRRLAGLGHSPS